MLRKLICLVSALFMALVASTTTNASPLNQDPGPDGIVSVMAVDYDGNIERNGVQWEQVGPTGGFTGMAGMQANGGGNIDTNYAATSPELDYEIDFVKTGTHYVWIRGWGNGGGDDSCHAGLDGQETPLSNRMTGWSDSYSWHNNRYEFPEPSQIDIRTTGLHVLNIWMREDGLIIDKIVLTTTPNYVPTGDGPPLSTRGPRVTAYNPDPADGATDVSPHDVVLSWTPGADTAQHDVYFGTNPDDVNQATATVDPAGVYQGRIDPNMYALPERLELGQTYYWRVDEVGADNTANKGGLWTFTTELFSYPIQNVIATASSSEDGKGPENTVNGSGLDATGLLHGNVSVDTMWLSSRDGEQPTWIQYEFDRIYKLNEMWVWNSNDSLESVIGLGLKDVTIEYSVDGNDFTPLGTTHEFAQAPGTADYAHNTTIDFEGVAAKFVRLTANSNWGGILNQYGLSEVRFFYIPISARGPEPALGAEDVGLSVTLSWVPGREAAMHDVYFSDDYEAVVDGTALIGNVAGTSYGPLDLELGTTYYWRVDEVNDAETPSTWQGDFWYFTTVDSLLVDDFESYTDDDTAGEAIWQTWIDGFGVPENGSQVGYLLPPYAEQAIVHSGYQSMPLTYDNTAASYSEATASVDNLASGRDWTRNGIQDLSLWFRGYPASVGNFVEGPAGTYTMTAGGTDIWNQADEFHYAFKQLSGAGSIVAKVESVELADVWTKAGVMIRETLDPGSKFAAVYITPTNADGTPTEGCRFQARTDTDGSATSDTSVATAEQTAITAPYWVKLERDVAGSLRAYYASDGVNWRAMIWRPSVSMGSTVYIGLALCSHNAALTAEAKFSNVQTTGTVTGQWQSQDIGILNNSAEPMYVALANRTGTPGIVFHDDPAATQIEDWTQWMIPLQAFVDQGIDLSDVDSISLGVGNKSNPQPGGKGTMFFDDVRLYPTPPVEVPKEADTIFEAESADTLGPNWRLYHDPSASGGEYIGSENGDGSDTNTAPGAAWVASYNFNAPAAGDYKVLLRVITPNGEDDSFWVRITTATSQTHEDPDQPGTGWVRFGIDNSSQWHWDTVDSDDHGSEVVNWTLEAGEHTLEIAKREDGALLDAILVTDDLDLDQNTL
jgi:hypothetical protein